MAAIIVASTRPAAGKTALVACLAARATAEGRKTAVAQAFAAVQEDAGAAAFQNLVPDAATAAPVRFSGAVPGDEETGEAIGRLEELASSRDYVVIEGLASATEQNLSLARALNGRVVLVAPFGDAPVVEARSYGGLLAGVVVNSVPRYKTRAFANGSPAGLEESGIPFLGWIPEDRRLVAPSLRGLAGHLEGEFAACEKHGDRLIDNLLIGGMVHQKASFYLGSRQDVAVLVRGERPDIQLAALQTETVRALILTGGVKPIEYVYYEAQRLGTPIVVVPADTHQAAAKLEAAVGQARFDHPDKLARYLELAEGRLDFAALDAALAQPVSG